MKEEEAGAQFREKAEDTGRLTVPRTCMMKGKKV